MTIPVHKTWVLIPLALVNFTNIMDVMIMMPLSDLFIETFDITPRAFAWLLSCYGIAAFLSSMVGVFYLDRFNRRQALLFIYAGFTIGTFLCGVVDSYFMLLLIRFVTGLFGGIIGALALSIVSDIYPFKERGYAISYLMAAFSAAAALGVPAGYYFATFYSWRTPFFIISGIATLIYVMLWIKFPRIPAGGSDEGSKLRPMEVIRAIIADRNIINALILGMVLVFGHFLIIPFITPYATRNVGFDPMDITWIYVVGGLITVLTAPLIGRLTDRVGVLPVFTVVMVLSFVPVIWLTNLGPASLSYGLIVTTLFFALGSGRMLPPQSLITSAVGPELRGSFMSLKSALQQLAIAASAACAGYIVSFDGAEKLVCYEYVGYLSVAVCIIALLIAPRLKVAKGNE